MLLFGVAYAQPLRTVAGNADGRRPTSLNWIDLPRRFWLYAAAVFVYGIVETLNGNWAMLYLSSERGVSTQGASFALAAFWVMVTVGRVLIARSPSLCRRAGSMSRSLRCRWWCFSSPARVQSEAGGIIVFGLAGLACSGFLPLSISFAGGEFPRPSAVMAGGLIAFYQLGYGVAAFGIGPLQGLFGLSFSTIFAAGSLVAAPIIVIAWFVIQRINPDGRGSRRK